MKKMFAFRTTLANCDLMDLGFTGRWYTWERGRFAENNIRERLDRGVANQTWWDCFPNFTVTHFFHSISDHCSILINSKGSNLACYRVGRRQFRFNAKWCLEEDCEEIIRDYWGGNLDAFPSKLE